MQKIYWVFGCLILGVILVVVSLLLPIVVPSLLTPSRSEEEAKRHAQIAAQWHQLAHEQAHTPDASSKNSRTSTGKSSESLCTSPNHAHDQNDTDRERQFAEAKQRYKESDAKLLGDQEFGERVVFWIKWPGVVLLSTGLLLFFTLRRQEE